MKRLIISALTGALCMLLVIVIMATHATRKESKPVAYVHVDYGSTLQGECFLCGEGSDPITNLYWGEDNVGIINLNTFELMRLEINRYDDHGQLITEATGCLQSSYLPGDDTYVHSYTYPDNGYSHVQITGVQHSIQRKTIQSRLCQDCLDTINELWFSGEAPSEYAIINFAERTIRPLVNCYPWFSTGNYGIDCEFKENGAIDLLVLYCPNRYA